VVTSATELAPLLWDSFVHEVASGRPVYFAFCSDLLRTAVCGALGSADDPVEIVCKAAAELFVVIGNEAFLTKDALTVGPNGFSYAIVLVCQQVLAVESMVRDPQGFSENAYFPRLRRLMSPSLSESSTNPFQFSEFESIWRALERDIRSVSGSTDASVTFRFGVEYGINKARAFPLSQALLTLEDLCTVVAGRSEKLRVAAAGDVWRVLKQVKSRLSRRAQRLVGLGFFRDRIAAQVVNYARTELRRIEERTSPPRKSGPVDLLIFRDTADWFGTGYRALLQLTDGSRILDDAQIGAALHRRVGDGRLLVLTLGELGDCWICGERSLFIAPGESFLVVGTNEALATATTTLNKLRVRSSEVEGTRGVLGMSGEYAVLQFCSAKDATEIIVRDGWITGVSGVAARAAYEWVGGVAVDVRKTRFLLDFLPTHAKFSDEVVGLEQMISVNQKYMSFASFRAMIEKEAMGSSLYEVAFAGGRRARLGVAINRFPLDQPRGHLVDESGKIAIDVDQISPDDFAVVGFAERHRPLPAGFDVRACALLLAGLRAKAGEPLSSLFVDVLTQRVDHSDAPVAVRAVLLKLLFPGALLAPRIANALGLSERSA
jgi:hypothetical protein